MPRNPWLGQQMQFDRLKRRAFITLLGGAAAWPLVARAQQTMPVIGFLSSFAAERFAPETQPYAAAFRKGLSEAGFSDSHNVIETHLDQSLRWRTGGISSAVGIAADPGDLLGHIMTVAVS
jgi:hypothetical protein